MQFLTIKSWFFEALFPPKCLICYQEGAYLCLRHQSLKKAPLSQAHFQHLDDIFAANYYRHTSVKKVVEYFKFRGFKDLASIMAQSIYTNTPLSFFEESTFVPVPLHWTRKTWRGFNQAEVIAIHLQKHYPHVILSTKLKRKKRTKQQARLDKKGRQQNLEKAFVWTGKTIPKKITLIDDVVASGSTLDAAAKILKAAGAKEVVAITFARGG